MALKQKVTFITEDGKEFATELEATGHETYLAKKKPIEVFLREIGAGRAHATYLRGKLPAFISFMETYDDAKYPDIVEPVADVSDAEAAAAVEGEAAPAADAPVEAEVAPAAAAGNDLPVVEGMTDVAAPAADVAAAAQAAATRGGRRGARVPTEYATGN